MDLMWVVLTILQFEIIHAMWTPQPEHFRIYLDHHESLVVPKYLSRVKILNPATFGDYLYAPQLKINKKLPKYVKLTSGFTKFKPNPELPSKWPLEKETPLEEFIRPVSLAPYHPPSSKRYPNFEDVKPVTEIIEGDLKYDFRTKTHSLR